MALENVEIPTKFQRKCLLLSPAAKPPDSMLYEASPEGLPATKSLGLGRRWAQES